MKCKVRSFVDQTDGVANPYPTFLYIDQGIHETEIISISAISEVEIVEIISVLSLKKSDGRN